MMMRTTYDEDEWETVVESRPCTVCHGDLKKCNGGCNGYTGIGQIRRPTADVVRIKAERQRKHEDAVLAEAEIIKAARLTAGK